ncbi:MULTISPECIES: hypothetical protein [Lelliottia]|uniref:hypothetical protein n=1 Tax=Lelliottia TaxID=1330545 RepID=UPI000743ABE1|nr:MULTISPECIES: hypothetical protein [Lelliottia]ATG03243.1 hypothetical protein CO697_17435 [Lelliottia amnigena]MBL5922065.1 hypothetical protein [Lelliottia amnigena]MCU7784386.1 hypothetical protein [Lelliottia amnigena]PEG63090.1 hypothetical protein CRH15_20285 [Lelliottia amnigena]QXA23514.1 hypothetical protein I6L74_09050 [Lelliottia amnigena]
MSKRAKWLLRTFTFLVMMYLLLVSGIFYPLAQRLQIPFASFMNYFNFGDPVLFTDYYSDNLEHIWLYIYVSMNIFSGVTLVTFFEFLVKLAKKNG